MLSEVLPSTLPAHSSRALSAQVNQSDAPLTRILASRSLPVPYDGRKFVGQGEEL